MVASVYGRHIVMTCLFGLLCLGPGNARAEDVVVKRFNAGTGFNSVGITAGEEGEDKEEDAPQALYAGDDGKVFVLDQVNGRILHFDPANPTAPPQTLQLPPGLQPTDLVVKGDDIYVWDGTAHALKALGAADAPVRGLTETRSSEPLDDGTQSAFAQMGSQPLPEDDISTRSLANPKTPDFSRQVVSTRGRGDLTVDIAQTDKGAGAELIIRQKGTTATIAKLDVRVRDRLGSVAFLEMDREGRSFVLLENIPNAVGEQAAAFVARYGPKGAIEGLYELPLASTTTVSRRFVTISPDGDVYFLRTQKTGVDIIGLGFRATPNAKILTTSAVQQPNYAALAIAQTKGMSMAVGPLTRDKIVQIAYGFEGVQWKLSEANYGSDPDQQCNGFADRIRRPMYLIGRKDEIVRSVPYCWGCQGSLAQFVARVEKGALAGNVCTKNNVRFDVVGVDCSSFVSATWGLSSHFATSAIPSITKELASAWDLLPGDALDKPGSHVVLFLGFTPDRKAMVMEASPGGCRGNVCRNIYPLSSLLARGFVPLRYRGLLEDTTASK